MKKILVFALIALFTGAQAANNNFTMNDWNREFYIDYLTALLSENHEQYDQALEYYLKAFNAYPESQTLKEDVVLMSIRAGKTELADSAAEALGTGTTFRSLAAYAQYSWAKGNIQTALNYYERALKLEPLNGGVLTQYMLLLSKANPQKALDFLAAHGKTYPDFAPMAYLERGNIFLSLGDVKNALLSYDKVTSLAPEAADPYRIRAEIYQRLKAYESALKEYESLLKMGKGDEEIYGKMGSLNIMLGRIDAAKDNFNTILKTNPSSPSANQFLAAISDDEGNYMAAAKYVMASADFDTNSTRQLSAAVYAAKAKDNALAEQILKDSYQKSKSTETGYYYAVTLQDSDKHKEAAKIFEQILKQSPDYDKAKIRLALSYSFIGADKKFERIIKPLYEKYPDNESVLNMYGYYLADKNKNLPLADQMLKRALELAPEEPAYMDSYGWLLYRMKDYDGALEWLLKAKEIMGEDPEVAAHIKQVYEAKEKNLKNTSKR